MCRVCEKTIDVCNMEESMVRSHVKSAKHNANMKNRTQNEVLSYVSRQESALSATSTTVPAQASDIGSACKKHEIVTDAEILLVFEVISSH